MNQYGLRITYLNNDKMLAEAQAMAAPLRENGIRCTLSGFSHSPGESTDAILDMAYGAPVIDAQIIPASHPRDAYVCGLAETKKNLKYIRIFKKNGIRSLSLRLFFCDLVQHFWPIGRFCYKLTSLTQ